MKLFHELGAEIEDLWNAENYNESLFPAIAADVLRRAGLPEKISAWDVIEWTLAEPQLPDQKDLRGNFGDPPITVFAAPRFFIDVYFWFEGTTAIHQHAFCGAFQVLLGSSIHSWYNFEPRHVINSNAEIGEMRLKVCEILNVGDVQEIFGGRDYIHSLFHLDHPSVTIVVRTYKIEKFSPQFAYEKPSLAIDPFYEIPANIKKLQAVFALLRAKYGEADRMISGLLERSDLQTTFEILSQLRSYLSSDSIKVMFGIEESTARFERFLEVSRKRHGAMISAVEDVIAHKAFLAEIVRRRGYLTDPEHRFFLALLLNVEGKERIFGLIKQKFPDAEPAGKVLDWVYDLANIRIAGATAQNALGVADFDNSDLYVFEKMLAGEDPAGIRRSVEMEYSSGTAGAMLDSLESRILKIKDAALFRPLFAGEQASEKAQLAL